MSGQRKVKAVTREIVRRWLVPAEGIEPPTFGLQNRCSTAELSRRPEGLFNGESPYNQRTDLCRFSREGRVGIMPSPSRSCPER